MAIAEVFIPDGEFCADTGLVALGDSLCYKTT